MSKNFESQLIEVETTNISSQIQNLEVAAEKLRQLKTAWENEFDEEFSFDLFLSLRTNADDPDLTIRQLKTIFIENHPVWSKQYGHGTGKKAIEKAFKDPELFPDYSVLANKISETKNLVKRINLSGKLIRELFGQKDFKISEKTVSDITSAHTHYTENVAQNLVLEICKKIAEPINLLNDAGAAVLPRDLPKVFWGCFTTESIGKKHSELEHPTGEGRFDVWHLHPAATLKNADLPNYLKRNLTDAEIIVLTQKLKSK